MHSAVYIPSGTSSNLSEPQESHKLGFYQRCPGKSIYSIVRPVFDKVAIRLPERKTFTIIAKNNTKTNKYIKNVTLNGQPLTTPFFEHKDIVNGGVMEITMSDKPTEWGKSN